MKIFKLILIIVGLLSITNLTAQDDETVNESKLISLYNAAQVSQNSSYGSSVYFVNPKRQVDGTVYLFDNWDNYAVIYTDNHQRFSLRNINLNIQRNNFESKVGRDSLFSFSFNNIEKFVINDRTFKNYYWDDDNRVYELIAQGKNFEILKGFFVTYIEGNSNPMLNRKNDKYVRSEKYFVRKDDKISSLILKKSRVLKFLNLNEQEKQKVLTFADDRKLSFKKEEDLRKIIEFVNKMKL